MNHKNQGHMTQPKKINTTPMIYNTDMEIYELSDK